MNIHDQSNIQLDISLGIILTKHREYSFHIIVILKLFVGETNMSALVKKYMIVQYP